MGFRTVFGTICGLMLASCSTGAEKDPATSKYIAEPLVTSAYTADPSAHYWDGKLYIYPSHDVDGDTPADDSGAHFEMRDYRVITLDRPGSEATLHGVALSVDDVPWADRQMWAPDAARKNGKYYLYFPAKTADGVFKIGAAVSDSPLGPFTAQPEPIKGSYSIDPAVFTDDDGASYMYFGGIWGGQLQRWTNGEYDPEGSKSDLQAPNQPALMPRVAKMSADMLEFAEEPRDVMILDKEGNPLLGGDLDRRFFEAAWIHKYGGQYYLSYSTGETHFIVYATGTSPYGPFTYQGKILEPVDGWTSHHSIAEVDGQWYLFYHDVQLSGETHLRNVKMTPLTHNADGSIQTIDPFRK